MKSSIPSFVRRAAGLLALLAVASCRPSDLPLHLEEHLDAARLEGSAVPEDLPAPVVWSFDAPQPGWKAVVPLLPGRKPATVETRDGALHISLSEANRERHALRGGVYIDLPGPTGWNRQDWSVLAIRARSRGPVGEMTLQFNLRTSHGERFDEYGAFLNRGEAANLINDGAVHSYLLRADWADWWEGEPAWRQLGLMIGASGPAEVEILSIELIPKEARFAEKPAGELTERREELYRRSLYVHAPARVEYDVRVPPGGRLDFGLGVLRSDAPVVFRVKARVKGDAKTLFEETYADHGRWGQRSVDLARWAGKTVRLSLEAAPGPGAKPGSVALWSAPTVSGVSGGGPAAQGQRGRPPNVILYVIDAGGAEYMSAYGYNRRTTPHLERLAAEGVLFENAHSNSTWSKPSTTSFMTGLHHTVLGGYETASDPLPEKAETMAQILHRAGWQTGVFTSNAWCGTMSGLDRGVDQLIESISGPNSASSAELQTAFWRWREAYPGQPFWAHFQSTDVHWPWEPVPPVAGVFLPRRERSAFYEMERKLGAGAGVAGRFWGLRAPAQAFTKSGVDRDAYFDGVRGVFDEAMAYTDLQLGRLVERLKASGEWENTVLIVTADHGDWPGLGYFPAGDPASDSAGHQTTRVPYLNPYVSRVPLVITWPARIAPGRRLREPVSLIDLLPTILDLTRQPHPAALQGQSLAPLLLGRRGWQPRPVIFDEMNVDPKTHKLSGAVEVIDGRWGASLAIQEEPTPDPEAGPRLLLYDLWNDPYCLRSLHAERPGLARRYTDLLERRFREHRALGRQFPRAGEGALGSSQLETLKSLGYIN